jgi:spermidine synthase
LALPQPATLPLRGVLMSDQTASGRVLTGWLCGVAGVAFICSGAFALVYQLCWVRAITLEFGATLPAAATVVGLFMGGLAGGAWWARRKADALQRPLLAFAGLELGISLYAAMTPFLCEHLLPVVAGAAAARSSGALVIIAVRIGAAAVVVLPAVLAMGATLPVLARIAALNSVRPARSVGVFYGLNTVGACIGLSVGGFLMLPGIGLFWTLIAAAAANYILAVLLCVVALRGEPPATSAAATEPSAVEEAPPADLRPALWAVAASGFAGMTCELVWIRVLSLVLGSSVFSYTIVTAVFLVCLGLGALITARVLARIGQRTLAFPLLSLGAAGALTVSALVLHQLPLLFVRLYWAWELSHRFDRLLLAQALLAACVVALPTLAMGGLFSAAAAACVEGRRAGRVTGLLSCANTIGAVAGSFAAGFALIPLLGVRGALLAAAATSCIAAVVWMGERARRQQLPTIAVAAGATMSVAVLLTPRWDHQLMTSAMYEWAAGHREDALAEVRAAVRTATELLYYRDGRTATITVTRDLRSRRRDRYIAANGKIDGSSHFDMPTQRISAHLPLLVHPEPRQVCVIGMGTGCTAGSAALHPGVTVDLVEIEAAMVEGARFFSAENHDVHEQPQTRIHVTDGRLFLRRSPQAYDVVISEPSNPWVSGNADLFTQEFFALGAAALRDRGLFCQWVQLYALSPANVQMVLRTFASVFRYTYVASTIPNTDLLLLGSAAPLRIQPGPVWRRMQHRDIRQDLLDPRVAVRDASDLLARFRFGPREVERIVAAGGPIHTDDLPLLGYAAGRDVYRDTRAANMEWMKAHACGVAPYLTLSGLPPTEQLVAVSRLRVAYERFLGDGPEARRCLSLEEVLRAQTTGPRAAAE